MKVAITSSVLIGLLQVVPVCAVSAQYTSKQTQRDTVGLLEGAVLGLTIKPVTVSGRGTLEPNIRGRTLVISPGWHSDFIDEPPQPVTSADRKRVRQLVERLRDQEVDADVAGERKRQTADYVSLAFSRPKFLKADSATVSINLTGGQLNPAPGPGAGVPGGGFWSAGKVWSLERKPEGWLVVEILDMWFK
jgi:hypothetical protein